MKIAIVLLLLGTGALEAQQAPDVTLFAAAYDTLKERLPSGPHAVVLSDPMLSEGSLLMRPGGGPVFPLVHIPVENWDEEAVQRGNREFARSYGMTLNPSEAVATVSFRLVTATSDSALVEVAMGWVESYPEFDWHKVALSEVRLVRRGGEWTVVSINTRALS